MNPQSHQSSRNSALAVILATIFLWAIGPILVKGFTRYYDSWTQNAFRYVSAAVMLLAIAAVSRRPIFVISRRQWGNLLLVVAANMLMQSFYARMLYYLYPAVATLVGQINIVLVVLLSFVFHRDERGIIRSPYFLLGSVLALVGVTAVVVLRSPETMARLDVSESRFWIGILITLLWAASSALYVVAIKPLVRTVDPFAAFTNVAWMTSIGLVILMLLFGHVSDLWRQPAAPLWGLIWSGLLCIGLAHVLYYLSIRRIKVVVVVTMMQMVPVITCSLSAFWYGDHLSPFQAAGGAVVLCGAWLASMAQTRTPSVARTANKVLAGEQKPS